MIKTAEFVSFTARHKKIIKRTAIASLVLYGTKHFYKYVLHIVEWIILHTRLVLSKHVCILLFTNSTLVTFYFKVYYRVFVTN